MLLALTPESSRPTSAGRTNAAGVERALYDAIQRGDDRQASQVYASLLPAVQATLLRVLGGPYRNHRELTQQSIEQVIALLSRHPTPWECRIGAWATTCAARVALEVLRGRVRSKDALPSLKEPAVEPAAGGADCATVSSAIDRLRWLLVELPRQQGEVVLLCDVMDLDAAEVAVTLQVGTDHVRRLLSAGHERLARQMAVSSRS
jgi:DNA-directed RNA polymerase specialized sigma24 family protein